MWVPPEVPDPILLHHPTRKSVAYFGAVRLRDGKFFCPRASSRFDAQSIWEFSVSSLGRTQMKHAGDWVQSLNMRIYL